jgi:intein/homing endonuclease
MTKLGMESFMLFMCELMEWCRENGINSSPCRGSVGGSVVAYITDIIDVDPIKWRTVFSRFCNEDRISLGDIDEDFSPKDRIKVYEYIINRFGNKNVSYILTLGTIQDRGSIDVLAKGLKYDNLEEVKEIKNTFDSIFSKYAKIIQEEVNLEELEDATSSSPNFDDYGLYVNVIRNGKKINEITNLKNQWDTLREENKKLFYYFDGIKGTIVSKGSHPSGMIGSPITLFNNIGVFYKDGNEDVPISFCGMKSVDSLNYVKFDILGLKAVGVIQDTYKLLGRKWEYAHEINWNDENVWNDMLKSSVGIFQFEGDFAFDLLSQFKPQAINDMSLVNASLRPSGKSYRNRLIGREFNRNPSDIIDRLLEANNGFLVFQEDTIAFLQEICGFSGSLADTTRRCINENSLIMMGNGSYKEIKNIQVGDTVQSFNKYNISEFKTVTNVFNNGIKDTYRIKAQHGLELEATGNHKVLTQRGWIEIDKLNTNDFIMTPRNINSQTDDLKPNKRLSETDMFLLGILIGDGTLGATHSLHFTNSEELLIDKFKECVNNRLRNTQECEFNINVQNGIGVEYIYSIYIKSKNYRDSVIGLLEKYNMRQKASDKHIPNEIMLYPKGSKLINLIAGVFNTDGGYNTQQSMIEYYTTSHTLAIQIKSLLLKYGIYSYIDKSYVKGYDYYSYRLYIRQIDSLNKFKQFILPYMIGKKKFEFGNVITDANDKPTKFNYLLPNECKNEILDMSKITNRSILSVGDLIENSNKYGLGIHKSEFGISDIKAKNVITNLYCPYTYSLLFADYIPIRIKSIEAHKLQNVYDIEVEDNHNYVANGIIVHNCIGKKDLIGLKEQLPKILEGYCSKSNQPREVAEKEVKEFIQIISDSSEYQFGLNHSTGYSMNGYMGARLRYYYPLEYTTAYLNNADNEEDIISGTLLASQYNIKVNPPKFRYSKAEYMFDKTNNSIYKGISSIKFLNETISNELYNNYKNTNVTSFIELVHKLKLETSIDFRQLKILTMLNYFSEYGKNQKLLTLVELYEKKLKNKKLKDTTIEKRLIELKETELATKDKSLNIKDQIKAEKEYMGYEMTTTDKVPDNVYIVTEIDVKYCPKLRLYNLNTGKVEYIKCKRADIKKNPFGEFSVIKKECIRRQVKNKPNSNGEWKPTDEFDIYLTKWEVII